MSAAKKFVVKQVDIENSEQESEVDAIHSNENSVLDFMQASSDSDNGESIWLLSYADLMTLLFSFFVLISSFSKFDQKKFEGVKEQAAKLSGVKYQDPYDKLKGELVIAAKELEMSVHAGLNNADIEKTESGVNITFRGSIFFDSGSADLRNNSIVILEKLASILKKQNLDYYVIVEGHTDDAPIKNEKFPSNWELSSMRASSVVRLFEKNGFSRKKLRALGLADIQPVVPNRNKDGLVLEENMSKNRRIVVKIQNSSEVKLGE